MDCLFFFFLIFFSSFLVPEPVPLFLIASCVIGKRGQVSSGFLGKMFPKPSLK